LQIKIGLTIIPSACITWLVWVDGVPIRWMICRADEGHLILVHDFLDEASYGIK
jgi:hypothetical protein